MSVSSSLPARILAAWFLCAPFVSTAQSTWLIDDKVNTVSLEWVRPSIKSGESEMFETGYGFFSSNLYLMCKYEVWPGFAVAGEIPFAAYSYETTYTWEGGSEIVGESGEEFGNPYLGVEVSNQERTVYIEAGFRLPVLNVESRGENTRFTLMHAEPADIDRAGAFSQNAVPLKIVLNGYPIHDWNNFRLKLRGGVLNHYLFYHGQEFTGSYLLYGAMLSYHLTQVEMQVGWGGMYVTGVSGERDKRAYESAALSVNVPFDKWNFGAVMRWSLTKYVKDLMSNIIHIGVGYDIL